MSSITLLSLLLICCGVGNAHCSTDSGNSTDMLSLLDFKRAVTKDPPDALNSWNTSAPHCQWKGVICSVAHPGRVRALKLTGQNLQGQIAPSLGNLTFLRTLVLSSNGFFGQLPSLSHLRRLQFLNVSNNNLQGFNPDALINCSKLRTLDLSFNSITGLLPQNIGSLSSLLALNLAVNDFSGIIPQSIQNITNLNAFALSGNQIQGNIPVELGQLPNMAHLFLGGNRLSGTVPTTLLNNSALTYLDLNSNFLQMELPSDIGDTLPKLLYLYLYNNTFKGHLPASLGNASFLLQIDLSSNNFTGQLPSSLGNLKHLEKLILDTNKFEARDSQGWKFLGALSNCGLLKVLSLYDNELHGAIPSSIGNLSTSLQILGFDKNYLSGTVPEGIGNLTSLTTLLLAHNNLTGPIGSWIGNLKNLSVLNLINNNFTGLIPSSIGSLTRVTGLLLFGNNFEGPIPPSLGSLPSLSVLNLSQNNLNGHIPKDLFDPVSTMITCTLSYNNLEGPVPSEISNLKHVTILDLSSNKLSGQIPVTLGECPGLEILLMGNNFLTGNIPKSFSTLKSLGMLNLSHNDLSGFIPQELSNMSSLTQLDLSYNNLEGQIPRDGVFANATDVYLGGNSRLCGGILDLHMPSCSAASGRKVAEYYLVRILIPVFGFMSLVLLIYFVVTEKRRLRQLHFSLSPLGQQFPKVSYNDLAEATQNFSESNLVGRGGYGSVYRGKLIQEKLDVAVKVLDLDMQGAEKSFLSECQTLRGIRHRNLVPIITACSTVDLKGSVFKALVFEFMPNGNLESWLHQREDRKKDGKATKALDLTQRTCFAMNIADALDYLHNESGRTIIHCDVKPSNILLDDDMNAHLGDFGIANFYCDSRSKLTGDTSSIGVKGTIGYIAPEYARGGRASTHGDVYSYGIVLLEMLTGKRPTDPLFVDELNIVTFVETNFPHQILQVIDTPLQEEFKNSNQANMVTESSAYQCMFALLQVALSCTRQLPNERVTMREAASKIRLIKTSYASSKPNASVM